MSRPTLICSSCNKSPSELDEYIDAASPECSGKSDMTPEDYCWEEEGTLNRENGHFLCSNCYVKAGMPSTRRGWTTP